jgi:hypothetical protein
VTKKEPSRWQARKAGVGKRGSKAARSVPLLLALKKEVMRVPAVLKRVTKVGTQIVLRKRLAA